jgi:hypothetical protein
MGPKQTTMLVGTRSQEGASTGQCVSTRQVGVIGWHASLAAGWLPWMQLAVSNRCLIHLLSLPLTHSLPPIPPDRLLPPGPGQHTRHHYYQERPDDRGVCAACVCCQAGPCGWRRVCAGVNAECPGITGRGPLTTRLTQVELV